MGLDMYAHRRYYVKQWEHQSPEERHTVQVLQGGKPILGLQPERISSVEEEVMRWWNALHIHTWFVENVQEGSDDCKPYYVDFDQLRQLHAICVTVIEASTLVDGQVHSSTVYDDEHPGGIALRTPAKVIKDATVAKHLLPTYDDSGYDERYLDEVVDTRRWIESMLDDVRKGILTDIYYSSGW